MRNQPLDEEEWGIGEPESREELEARYQRALNAAGRQLSYRALSEAALRDKLLEKGHAEDAAEYAIAWLLERGLLNDMELAEASVRSYIRKGYGYRRIRQELRHRGIPADVAAQVMEGYSEDTGQMVKLLEKRLRGDLSDRKEVQKAVAALQRRGFRWGDIRRALDDYGAQLDEETEEPFE